MRAVQIPETGDPSVLRSADLAEPTAGDDDLLVEVAAAGVNYIDTYHRSGAYPLPLPAVLGLEGAGRVRGTGERVAWAASPGSYAEVAAVPRAVAVPVPDGVDDATAAALLLQGLTAHYLCTSTYAVQPGDWVVVHAAAGGVGLLLTQLVAARGGRVIATVGSAAKAELAQEAGAEVVVRYDEVPFAEAVREATDGAGAAAVFDGVGKTTFEGSLDSLRPRGVLALYGAASGPVPPLDPQVLNRKGSLFLTRPSLVHYTATREELLWRAGELFAAVEAYSLQVRIGATFPLEEAARAHEELEGRRTTGKVLLTL